MGRRNDDGEDDKEDLITIRDSCGGGEDDDDDEEGNEDLSLKILEKALSKRNFDDSKETSMPDLSGSGVVSTVMVNGVNSKADKKKRTKLEISSNEESVVEDEPKGEEDDAEPKPGETSSNMVLKKLLRGARYFDPPDAGWMSCYSCGEQGHITVNCPTPKRRRPCFICGSLEHGAKQCSKGHDCYICKKSGHRAKDCPDKYKSGHKTAVCLRCGDFGHDMILCKYEYTKDDLKDVQCYVCKSFGHLCCVEPSNSLSWAVSCYRCGQLGHTGLACGRHYDESTENDTVISSCFKCGGEGHLKRDCPNSSSLGLQGNSREIPSVCYRCGEEGHFSRECPNSSSIGTSQSRDSPSICYRCEGRGHFARECPSSSQGSKRTRDQSTPSHKPSKKNKESAEKNSSAHESNGKTKKTKKNKTKKGEQPQTTPRKPKHRGGWITEDPEEESFQRGKIRRPRSPTTPSSNDHRIHSTHMGHNHRIHSTPESYEYRSPTINSGGRFQGSQSTTPYGRNHRNSSFESNRHNSGHHQQSYYPHHHNHQEDYRYAPEPSSRYGPSRQYGEVARNYDRY